MAGETRARRDLAGRTTEYADIAVAGERVEQLLRELFTDHWKRLTVGPVIQGAAWEVRFTTPPSLSMLDGYLTVDLGPWHFHLCVGETRGQGDPALARARRVGRAAFFRTVGGTCVSESYGLRLWNGLGEQMMTVFFPNPFYGDDDDRLRQPDRDRAALWDDFRRRYCG